MTDRTQFIHLEDIYHQLIFNMGLMMPHKYIDPTS